MDIGLAGPFISPQIAVLVNSKDGDRLLKFLKSDKFYNPDQAFGRLFIKELEDWKNLIADIGNVEGIPSTEKNQTGLS